MLSDSLSTLRAKAALMCAKDEQLQKGVRTVWSYHRLMMGVAAALLAAVSGGCAAQQPQGPEPWVTAGQQASAAASRADAAAGRAEAAARRAGAAAARTEVAAQRLEEAMARAEASAMRSMRK